MYRTFYGFRDKPFSLLPDPECIYLSQQHQMAMTLLEYSLEHQAGFCVITGKIGTGKTTLIRHLLNQVGRDISVGLISNTHQSFSELLRWILLAFNLETAGKSKAELHRTFTDYLIGQYAGNKRTMLIVDEAQNMSPDGLEELRMLSNINSEKDLLLQIVLVGQPGLRELLQRPELEQLTQRVAVDYHLEPLNCAETHGYVRHRVTAVGGKPELFSDAACDAVFRYCGGTPRLINLLCDLALVYGYAESVTVITGELVDRVVRERQKHGVLQIFSNVAVNREDDRPAKTVVAAERPGKSQPASSDAHRRSSGAAAQKTRMPEVVMASEEESGMARMAERAHKAVAMKMAEQRMAEYQAMAPAQMKMASVTASAPDDGVAVAPEEGRMTPPSETAPSPAAFEADGQPPASGGAMPENIESTTTENSTGEPMSDTSHVQELIPVAVAAAASRRIVKSPVLPLGLAAVISAVAVSAVWWMLTRAPGPATIISGPVATGKINYQSAENTTALPATSPVNNLNSQKGEIAKVGAVTASAGVRGDDHEQLKLKALERERDAALARTRALERERNAVLESARALAAQEAEKLREQAALEAVNAVEREKAYQAALMAAMAEMKMLEESAAEAAKGELEEVTPDNAQKE